MNSMQTLAPISTAFIGRSEEIAELSGLLDQAHCRLLTLVGPGGIGKTRLALEVIAQKKEAFTDGVFFVELAPLSHTDNLLMAVAEAMPFSFQQDHRNPREQFFDYLREKSHKKILLVLDNFEHLLDGVDTVSEILAATEQLKILVTSREALNLQEEWVRQILGMDYPNAESSKPLEDYHAVQLFLDRAQRIRGDFSLREEQHSVVEICRLVGGMPLAIELAAGWLTTLPAADIAHEIQHNMDILATRSRNLPERHRSIRSVFNHSWQLLSDEEREVFQKLAVFRGGFSREAAEVVAGASLHILADLVDKSLVRRSATGRYDLHELLRQYGSEQLAGASQTEAVQTAYFEYYLHLLCRLEPHIKSHQQISALDSIAADFENIRTAWGLAVECEHLAGLDEAVESLHFFADMRGRYHEVVNLLNASLEQLGQHQQSRTYNRIQARLIRLVLLGNMRIDFDVRGQIEACLTTAKARQDQAEMAYCYLVAGIITVWEAKDGRPNYTKALRRFYRSYSIYKKLDDPFYVADNLAWIASCISDSFEASDISHRSRDLLMQSLALRRQIGDRNGIAWITLNLVEVTIHNLDYAAWERYAREALALMREIGSIKGIAQALYKVAEISILGGDLAEARQLTEELASLADETNNLDGRMLATGLRAFLTCVMEEDYTTGAALAQENYDISQQPFFGWNANGARWGKVIAACGLGDYDFVRQNYPFFPWDRPDDPGVGSLCLSVEALALAHEGALETATEYLSLAAHQPTYANGWMQHWGLLDRLQAHLKKELGAEAYHAAWERGANLDLESSIQALLGLAPNNQIPSSPPNPIGTQQAHAETLSERELEVLRLIADGLSNREIAERLYLSIGTIKVHTRNIYSKLNVNSRTQALARAHDLALL